MTINTKYDDVMQVLWKVMMFLLAITTILSFVVLILMVIFSFMKVWGLL